MSGEISNIRSLWSKGEELSLNGQHPDALVHFQRAKKLLLDESKALYGLDSSQALKQGAKGPQVPKLMGDIMNKLTDSINRDVKLINANPVHALGLKRGFGKSDVKKAYHRHALKFHPDKNHDCDTSGIFSAIQASYEKLNAALDSNPMASVHMAAKENKNTSSAHPGGASKGAHRGEKDDKDYSQSKFYSSHKDIGRRPRPSPYEFDQTRHAKAAAGPGAGGPGGPGGAGEGKDGNGKENSYYFNMKKKSGADGGGGLKHKQKPANSAAASAASGMSTEQLREVLKAFGFEAGHVDRMFRAELIKKYLAVNSYVDKESGHEGSTGTSGTREEKESRKRKGQRPSAYRVPPVFYPEDSDEGMFDIPTPDGPLPDDFPGAEHAGGGGGGNGGPQAEFMADPFEAFRDIGRAWAEEWTRQMQGVLGREERAHHASMGAGLHGKKSTSTSYHVNRNGNSNVRIPSRRQSKEADEGYVAPGYEYVHVPKGKDEEEKKKAKGAQPGAKAKGKSNPSPYASSYYTKQQARTREEELLAKKLAQHGYTMGADAGASKGAKGIRKGANPSGEGVSEEEDEKRRDLSDALRQERAAWLQQRLPTMTLKELLRITEASGLPAAPFAERAELVAGLCKYYGISDPSTLAGRRSSMDDAPPPTSSTSTSSSTSNKDGKAGKKKGAGARRGSGAGVSPAEAALNSKLNNDPGAPQQEGAGGRQWAGIPVEASMGGLEEVVQTATGKKDGADLYARQAKGADPGGKGGSSKVVPHLPLGSNPYPNPNSRRSSTAESGSNSSRSGRSRSGSRGPSSAREGGKTTPRYAQDTRSSNQSSSNNSDYSRRKREGEGDGGDHLSPRPTSSGSSGGRKTGSGVVKGMHPGQYITKERLKELERRVIGQGRIRGRNGTREKESGKESGKGGKGGQRSSSKATTTTATTTTSADSTQKMPSLKGADPGGKPPSKGTHPGGMPSLNALLSSAARQAARYDLRHSIDADEEHAPGSARGGADDGEKEVNDREAERVVSASDCADAGGEDDGGEEESEEESEGTDEGSDSMDDGLVERLRSKGWDFGRLGLNLGKGADPGQTTSARTDTGFSNDTRATRTTTSSKDDKDGTEAKEDATAASDGSYGTIIIDDASSLASGAVSRITATSAESTGSSYDGNDKSREEGSDDEREGGAGHGRISIAVGDDNDDSHSNDEDEDEDEDDGEGAEASLPPAPRGHRAGLSDQISPITTYPEGTDPGMNKVRSPVEVDKDREEGREQVFTAFLEGLEAGGVAAGHVAVPPKEALSGRIRARRRSGVKGQDGGPNPNDGSTSSGTNGNNGSASGGKKSKPQTPLALDLSQLDAKGTEPGGVDNVQEEVDFWVHSARSDEGAGNSYRDLDRELRRRIAMDKENLQWMGADPGASPPPSPNPNPTSSSGGGTEEGREKPRAVSPIVSPKNKEAEGKERSFLFFG